MKKDDDFIIVKGAKEHNLKNIDVKIPKNELTVITGLSGSGKSSLAFATIYNEGQRRYVESLSAYARQFLNVHKKPDVEYIKGLSPAISIEQKATSNNPRSTVGTITEIYDYMRLLWARIGVPYSPVSGKPITTQTIQQMTTEILKMDAGTKIMLLAPIAHQKKGEFKTEAAKYQKEGFQRLRIDGEVMRIDEFKPLKKTLKHDFEIVVDRLVIKHDDEELESRIVSSLETITRITDGLALVLELDPEGDKTHSYSEKFYDPDSDFTLPELEPRLFSFNSPIGACFNCDGLGHVVDFNIDDIIPDTTKSFEKCFDIGILAKYLRPWINAVANHFSIDKGTRWYQINAEIQHFILYGGDEEVAITYKIGRKSSTKVEPFVGIVPLLAKWAEGENGAKTLKKIQTLRPCQKCEGKRLNNTALAIKVHKKSISEVTQMNIVDALDWFNKLPKHLNKSDQFIAERILREITERAQFLINVGLNYLTLSRSANTLSGGESQRIRLASQIGSGLTGVLYVLDEPSIGLHQRDNVRLLESLDNLKNLGNTVVVVEHDEDTIKLADWLIDIGPGAGINGGEVIFAGLPKDLKKVKNSITGDYIFGRKKVEIPEKRREGNGKEIVIHGACSNNLQNVTATIPLGTLTTVTGVSGSGKSTLVIETLGKALSMEINNSHALPENYDTIEGIEHIDKVIHINQQPIGRTPRSNPATYTGVFDNIREWFASLPQAKALGYNTGRFSFNVKGGRCESCKGDGQKKVEMHFLPDIHVMCEECKGKRYNNETLSIKYKGKSIADVLAMSIEEAMDYFDHVPKIQRTLQTLMDVGLNYIKLGQSATTLSGGEAQRIKLSKELAKRSTGRTFYILDEPTTGLHFHDIHNLLKILQRLVDQGNTVLTIEHNLDIVKASDHLIDVGPDGGVNGGRIIATGTPEQVAKVKGSHTGHFLKEMLKQK